MSLSCHSFLLSMGGGADSLEKTIAYGILYALAIMMFLPGPAAISYGLIVIARRKVRLISRMVFEGGRAVVAGCVITVLGIAYLCALPYVWLLVRR